MSRAWFSLAFLGVLGLFYVGYGLQCSPVPAIGGLAFGQEAKPAAAKQPGKKLQAELEPPPPPVAKLKWELLAGSVANNSQRATPPSRIHRSKIPGGWLVETYRRSTGNSATISSGVGLTFVPDPDHKWDGASLP
jgi:hypothetical protein